MQIGAGLPTTLPGADGELIMSWARQSDLGPFTSLAVLDRVVYDSYDSLSTLAAAAAVTTRVRLATTILISPLYNTVLLGKMAATIHALSRGRLSLGIAVGARRDDYLAAGAPYQTRGARLVEQLVALRKQWEGEGEAGGTNPATPLSPATSSTVTTERGNTRPELLIGGLSEVTFARVARYADGYVHGGGPPRAFARAAAKACSAWVDAGRPGLPRVWAQGYFALGDEATIASARQYLGHYYAFTGRFAERIVDGLLTTPQAIAQFARGYADAGCDELVLFPAVAELEQLHRLAEVVDGLPVEPVVQSGTDEPGSSDEDLGGGAQ
jgi:alkanesulfonate monooxygenase SsuD/methylene tetrahydromethanopterin reductase-like flavin-dependent oxidoreductase (luciferase family)